MLAALIVPPLSAGCGSSGVKNKTRIVRVDCRPGAAPVTISAASRPPTSVGSPKVARESILPGRHVDSRSPRLIQTQDGEHRFVVGRTELLKGRPFHPQVLHSSHSP